MANQKTYREMAKIDWRPTGEDKSTEGIQLGCSLLIVDYLGRIAAALESNNKDNARIWKLESDIRSLKREVNKLVRESKPKVKVKVDGIQLGTKLLEKARKN